LFQQGLPDVGKVWIVAIDGDSRLALQASGQFAPDQLSKLPVK
jgi:hypothetical protein